MRSSGLINFSAQAIRDKIDSSSSAVIAQIAELTSEVRAFREQVAKMEIAQSEHSIPDGYVIAKDSDFEWKENYPWNGAWHYIGKAKNVAIPHTIKGKKVISYQGMFHETSVKSVYSDNVNVTDMSYMFSGSKSKTLDLSNLIGMEEKRKATITDIQLENG